MDYAVLMEKYRKLSLHAETDVRIVQVMMPEGKYGRIYPDMDEHQTIDNDLRYLNIAQLKDKQEQGKTDPYPSRI